MHSNISYNSIVIDSNVWISALVFGGNSRLVFESALKNGVVISVSSELFTETKRVVLKKFKSFKSDLEVFIEVLLPKLNYINLGSVLVEVCRDPNDNYIIETALISRSKYLITGDKDLLSLKKFKGIKIVTPSEYLSLA